MTTTQMATIRAMRVDATARQMMLDGVTMTHAEADELGQERLAWLHTRLGLLVTEQDSGVVAMPERIDWSNVDTTDGQ